jgi:phosphogluconate dehydratase
MQPYTRVPYSAASDLAWRDLPEESPDDSVVRTAGDPFSSTGGLRVLEGNLGRAVVKVSAVPKDGYVVEAPALLFDTQEELLKAFKAGSLERDFVAVIRFQGPRANGMPELHKLTSPLVVLQKKGYKVALVTDGRMSGASGAILAAIHVSPEILAGGPLGRVREGDTILVDALRGRLNALVPEEEWWNRAQATISDEQVAANARDLGRDLFGGFRRNVLTAEEGAISWL